MKLECNLCGMILPDEPDRIKRHNEFHSTARIQKRNTTNGIPEWRKVE